MIEISSLSKNFGEIVALKDVNLEIAEPGITTFLGENGAGKTTLFKILTGMVRPSRGKVLVNGIDIQSQTKKVLSLIGSLVEQPEFYPYLTGRELLEFTGKMRGLRGNDLEGEVERVSKMMSMDEYLDRTSGSYSRGMKQRLGVAVAMIGDPKIIILDEPTFGMDPRGIIETRRMLKKMRDEGDKFILMSTHLLEEARELSSRIVILKRGEIRFDSSRPFDEDLVKIVGDIRVPKDIESRVVERGSDYVLLKADEDTSQIISYLISQGSRIRYIFPSDRLEEHFLGK
ncbi:MAG: ABC transporter ATP-binding protein [Thermoplasmata archaeon]